MMSASDTGSSSVVMLLLVKRAIDSRDIIIITNVDPKSVRVDGAVAPEQECTKDGFSQDVEDTVEDGLRVRRDDVASLAQTPSDRVEEPEEDGPAAADEICARHVRAEGVCVLATYPGHLPRDEQEGHHAENEESPLQYGSAANVRYVVRSVHTLYEDLTRAPTRPVTIMTSSIRMVKRMVGHGRPAVRSRSKSKRGVVMNLSGSLALSVLRTRSLVLTSQCIGRRRSHGTVQKPWGCCG